MQALPDPTDAARVTTTIADPDEPLRFSFPDLERLARSQTNERSTIQRARSWSLTGSMELTELVPDPIAMDECARHLGVIVLIETYRHLGLEIVALSFD